MRQVVVVGALGLLGLSSAYADDLDRKIASVQPSAKEDRWLKIPWERNLLRARIAAQKAKKPLLIWIMDGNVLGST